MKTFVSIGAGPGISYAAAERFAQAGMRIVLCARNSNQTRQLAGRLQSRGHDVYDRVVDSADPDNVAALIGELVRQFGSIDVLHYNAAAKRKANILEQSRATFIPDLAVNIGGALAATQAVLGEMIERRAGTILLTGGGYGLAPNPEYLSLSIGKAGIRALTLGLFENLQEKGIHIATVTVTRDVVPESLETATIGERFWELHNQPAGSWTPEVRFPN